MPKPPPDSASDRVWALYLAAWHEARGSHHLAALWRKAAETIE
jgi:hypothetical protein